MILISATPSPFARKVRIALMEKGVPFTLQNEVPWHHDTQTICYNPLEQLPVLIPDDAPPVFESSHIMEWIEWRYPAPPLLPAAPEAALEAKQVQVISEGCSMRPCCCSGRCSAARSAPNGRGGNCARSRAD